MCDAVNAQLIKSNIKYKNMATISVVMNLNGLLHLRGSKASMVYTRR